MADGADRLDDGSLDGLFFGFGEGLGGGPTDESRRYHHGPGARMENGFIRRRPGIRIAILLKRDIARNLVIGFGGPGRSFDASQDKGVAPRMTALEADNFPSMRGKLPVMFAEIIDHSRDGHAGHIVVAEGKDWVDVVDHYRAIS